MQDVEYQVINTLVFFECGILLVTCFLLSVVCRQADVSATGRPLLLRRPAACVVFRSVIGESHRGGLGPLGLLNHEKKINRFF
jgi:hypothetical protein